MKDIGIKKKKIKKAAIILITIYLLAYWIGTWNIGMGSSKAYPKTPFHYVQSEWYCKKYNLTGKIINSDYGLIMEIKDSSNQTRLIVRGLNNYIVEMYKQNKIGEFYKENSLGINEIFSKLRWGKAYKFTIVDSGHIFSGDPKKEEENVTFVRK